jgi:peptide-methionine (R)-S-oxide reductase
MKRIAVMRIMPKKFYMILAFLALLPVTTACSQIQPETNDTYLGQEENSMLTKVTKTDEEWQRQLTPEQYQVTRQKGTERPFTGKYYNFKEEGSYRCVCCGNELFSSEAKFDSGTGWPSFWAPFSEQRVKTSVDDSYGMVRVEVM